MTKYLLADRERNGYDDSDFYAIFWNTETNRIESETYGSTRWAGGPYHAPESEYLRPVPQEILDLALAYTKMNLFAVMCERDALNVMEPEDCNRGDRLTLLKKGTFKDRQSGEKLSYAAGDSGVVIWTGNFGTFYRNGYNRPGRHNCRVGIKLDSGKTVFVALEKCRLARETRPLCEIMRDAENQANYQARFGWM